MVSDPDATIPVPKPIPAPDAGVTPSQVGNLFVAGAGAFDTRPASSGTRGWEPPSVEVLQALLPQYEITAFLARGGMGAVYQGLQRALKRPVAIKVLPPEMVDEDDGGLQFAARFKQEAQAMARLSHPNIVAVFDAGEVVLGTTGRGGEEETLRPGEGETGREQGSGQRSEVRSQKDGPAGATLLYFVMEFIEGTDVAQLIASEGPLDAARVVPIIAAVCEALAFAHEEGIVHRDIKPSNIMIDRKGRVKVADFGLAKAVNLESTLMTRSDVAMGTPDFVAPEALIPGMAVDGRADLYAVGVMLYQMLTGKIPRGRFELPSGVIPQVDHRFDAIVDRAMQTDREKRYPTATEMRREVESVGIFKDGSAGTPARISSNGGAAAKSQEAGKSARAPVVLAAAAVVVLGLGAFFITQEPTGQGKVPPPSSSTAKEAAGWSLVDLEAVRLAERGLTTAPGGWYRMTGMQTYSPFAGRMTNAGLRVEVGGRLLSGRMPEILLREQETRNYNAFLDGDGQSLVIQRYDGTVPQGHPDHYRTLGSQRLKKPVSSGSPYTLEFVAVGRRLRARINDTTLEVEAPDPPAAGLVTLYNPDFDTFRQIERINLDGLSEAEALKVAGLSAPAPLSWHDWIAEKRSAGAFVNHSKLRDEGTKLHITAPDTEFHGPSFRNGRVRVEWKCPDTNGDAVLFLRYKSESGNVSRYQAILNQVRGVKIGLFESSGSDKKWTDLKTWPLPKDFDWTRSCLLEFAAVNDVLTVSLNGQEVGSIHDSKLTDAGECGFTPQNDTQIMKFEYQSLDGSRPSLASAALSQSSSATETWINALARSDDSVLVNAKLTAQGLELAGQGQWKLKTDKGPRRDGAMRLKSIFDPGATGLHLRLRCTVPKDTGHYRLALRDAGHAELRRVDMLGKTGTTLADYALPAPLQPGQEYEMELGVVGTRLTAKLNGAVLGQVEDTVLTEGQFGVGNSGTSPVLVQRVEYLNLDGSSVSPSPALPVSPSSTSAPDRAAALRVLERGGKVMISTSAGVTQNVTDSAALPAGTFTLEQAEVRTKSGSKSGFTDADMALLTGLPKLRRIILVETQITGAALAVLKTLPALKDVELDRNKALRDDDLKHLAGCPSLEAVSLHHPEMFTAAVVEHLSALRQLTKLEIGELTLGSAEVKHLLRLTKLQTLRVSRTSLRAADLEQLQALPSLQTITVSLAQLERPMSFGSFPSLTKIVIDDALTSDAVKSLGTASKLETLNLDLPGRMEAAIFTEIARTLKNLKSLTLNLDQPLPPGEPLAALAALPKLERVALGLFTGINQFDDAALLSLAKVPTLKVFLLGTQTHRVTAQGIAAFQKLRPDVKIEGTGLAAASSGPLSAPSKTDASPTAAASSPNLPVSKSSPFPPGQWMDVTDEVRSAGIKDGTLKVNGQDLEATRKKGFILQGGRHYTDVAVRVRYAGWLALKLRQNASAEAYGIMVQPADNPPHRPWVRLDRQMGRQGHGQGLEAVELTRWLNAGLGPPEAMHDFIFAVQGTQLRVWLDGSLLGTITDDKITSPGRIELVLMSMDTKGFTTLRKVEIANLDGLSEAEVVKAAGIEAAAPSPSPSWSDVTTELRSAGLASGSLKLDGDWLETVRTTWPSPAGSRLFRDFAVRITYANRVEVQFRKTTAGSYVASAEGDVCGLFVTDRSDDRQRLAPITKLTPDYDAAAAHEFFLLARGPQLSIWIDGRKQAEAADARHPEGGVSLSLFADGKTPPPRIKKVEYLLLDGLGEAEALKAAGLSSRGAEQPAGGSAAALQDGKPASSPTHPPAAWQPVTFVANAPGMEDLTVTANGGLRLNRGFTLGTFYGRNMAVRALLKRPEGVLLSGLKLRQRGPNSVSLFFGARQAWMDTVSVLPPKTPCLDLKPGQGSMTPVRLLLAAIGNQVYGRVDDTWLPPFTLSGVALEGSSAMWSMDGEFSEVQVLLMDELDETQARQAIGLTGAALPEPSAPAPAATAAWTLAYGKPLSALANSDGTRTLEYGGLKVRGGLPDVHLNSTQGMVRMGIAWMPGTRSVKLGLKGTNIELSLHESGRAELRRATHPGYEANPPGITLAKPAEQPGVELRLAWINQDVHAWAGGRYIGRQVIPSDRATSQGVWFSNDAADQEVRVTSYDIMDMKRMTPDEARKTAGVPHG